MPEVDLTIDASEAERELASLKHSAEITLATALSSVRKGFATISLFTQAAGTAINLSLDMLIQSMLLFGEALSAQATAESFLGSPRALILYGMATVFFYRAVVLQGQRSEITDAFDSIITGASIWLF